MSRLYERGLTYLKSAKHAWTQRFEDDMNIDLACFLLQQSIEFLLKYSVELSGQKYVENHDLRAQINKLKNAGIQNDVLIKIQEKASTYNKWETETRYKDNFSVVSSDVEEAISLCEELISFINILREQYSNVMDTEGIAWCRANAPEALKTLSDGELWNEMKDIYFKYK